MRRLLTHFLSAALLCAFHSLAAQPVFPPVEAAKPVVDTSLQLPGPLPEGQLPEIDEPASGGRGKLQLRWKLPENKDSGYLRVERSATPAGPFEVLSVIRLDGVQQSGVFTDDLPLRGINHYRVVFVSPAGNKQSSRVASTGLAGEMSCRFYPNPVDNMLIIRSEQALDMLLSDANGKPRLSMKLKAGLQTVDVSSLEKGMYIITLVQTETGRSLTEKLLKN